MKKPKAKRPRPKFRYFYWVVYKTPTGIKGAELNAEARIDSSERICDISTRIAKSHGKFMHLKDILIHQEERIKYANQ